jgi:hypothetical protein
MPKASRIIALFPLGAIGIADLAGSLLCSHREEPERQKSISLESSKIFRLPMTKLCFLAAGLIARSAMPIAAAPFESDLPPSGAI